MTSLPSIPQVATGTMVTCPECGEHARIVDRYTLAGAPEPVEHVKVVCEAGDHWFTLPLDRL